jgi:glycosyltransferase involved in cell wall biosynthesis
MAAVSSTGARRGTGAEATSGRIALVITGLGAGGAERVLVGMANHWAAKGIGVTLISFEPPGTPSYYPLDPGVELRQLDLKAQAGAPWRTAWQSMVRVLALRRAFRACRPDVAIAFLAKVNIITVVATRGLGLPVILSERNNPERQGFSPVWVWLRHRLYALADGFVTPSRGVLECFPDPLRARGRVISNPVDLPPSPPARAGSRTLVAVGRLVEQKGFDLLLEAFASIAPGRPDWRLVIWGEGPERGRLEALRDRLGLGDRVALPGLTARPGQWTEDAALFVLSSRYESFGNVITEAMASGLPVVAFDCPFGPGEIVRDGVEGVLVPPEDVAALAAALAALLADPERRVRLGAAARAGVQRFERTRVMALWDDLIAEVTAARWTEPEMAPLSGDRQS